MLAKSLHRYGSVSRGWWACDAPTSTLHTPILRYSPAELIGIDSDIVPGVARFVGSERHFLEMSPGYSGAVEPY